MAGNRLSTSRLVSTPPVRNNPTDDKVSALELRLMASIVELCHQLKVENSDLRYTVTQLQSDLANLRDQVVNFNRVQTCVESGISLDQQELNTNIIIRGINLKEDAQEYELCAIYSGIRTHLGIAHVSEFDPVCITIVPSIPGKPMTSSRPIIVQLSSVAAKRQFLQVRRIKKAIFPTDIALNQE